MLTFNVFLDKKKKRTVGEAQNTRHQYHLTIQTRPYIVSSPTISKNPVNPDTRNTVWLFNYTTWHFEVTPADFNETALKIHLPFQVRNYIFLNCLCSVTASVKSRSLPRHYVTMTTSMTSVISPHDQPQIEVLHIAGNPRFLIQHTPTYRLHSQTVSSICSHWVCMLW